MNWWSLTYIGIFYKKFLYFILLFSYIIQYRAPNEVSSGNVQFSQRYGHLTKVTPLPNHMSIFRPIRHFTAIYRKSFTYLHWLLLGGWNMVHSIGNKNKVYWFWTFPDSTERKMSRFCAKIIDKNRHTCHKNRPKTQNIRKSGLLLHKNVFLHNLQHFCDY